MRLLQNIAYNGYAECKLDAYLPDEQGFKTIVYFHGGGLVEHGKDGQATVEIAKRFAQEGYGFVSADYRIYPTAKAPDFLTDAADAVAFVKARLAEWGGNGEMLLSGQSAGAWLCLMLCLNEKYLSAVGVNPLQISGWMIDSAQTTAHFNVLKNEFGVHPLAQRINEYAPQFFVNENTKFSKLLLLYYEQDIPCRPEQNRLFYRSVLEFDKQADIEIVQLAGGHCHGSSIKDDDGEYEFVKVALRWLKQKNL